MESVDAPCLVLLCCLSLRLFPPISLALSLSKCGHKVMIKNTEKGRTRWDRMGSVILVLVWFASPSEGT